MKKSNDWVYGTLLQERGKFICFLSVSCSLFYHIVLFSLLGVWPALRASEQRGPLKSCTDSCTKVIPAVKLLINSHKLLIKTNKEWACEIEETRWMIVNSNSVPYDAGEYLSSVLSLEKWKGYFSWPTYFKPDCHISLTTKINI